MARKREEPSDYWVKRLKDNPEQFGIITPQQLDFHTELARSLGLNKYIPIFPSSLQFALRMTSLPGPNFFLEGLVAGERRASKTTGLLIDCLLDCLTEDFTALVIRENIDELTKARGIIDTLRSWLLPWPEWTYNVEHREFRNSISNAVIAGMFLGEKRHEDALFGFDYDLIILEEITRLPFTDEWNPYPEIISSLSAKKGRPMPARLRASSNPGGDNELWVMRRFLPPHARRVEIAGAESYLLVQEPRPPEFEGIIYVHALTVDNPAIDAQKFRARMKQAGDAEKYEQLAEGKWGVSKKGGVFHPEKFVRVPFGPPSVIARRRGADKAGTAGGKGARTALVRVSRIPKGMARAWWGPYCPGVDLDAIEFVIEHVAVGRWSADQRESNIDAIALGGVVHRDDGGTTYWPGDPTGGEWIIEQEPGSGGKDSALVTVRRLVGKGVVAREKRVTGDKESRAHQMAAAVNSGMYAIVDNGEHIGVTIEDILAEFRRFKNDATGTVDIVDGGDLCHNELIVTPPVGPPLAGEPRPRMEGLRFGNEPVRAGQM